ncbi:TRAP transporter substrate-binding protein [Halotia wernerae UHCC 0503]|jgi:tripartite ATP-independent transporter DctP family solute receptor|nr:TRAP transporter substrate-binding protein [Halotia wernerae UHCC 0503]
MKRQSFLRGVAAAAAVALAVLAPDAAVAQAKKQIKISHATAVDLGNDNHMVAWVMRNYINEFSDTLDARIYGANQLGEERAVVEGMQLGAGATCHVGGTAIHNNFVRRMGVLDLPFMWQGYDHAHKVLDGEVGKSLAKEYEARGIKILGWQDSWGYRNVVTTKKEIKTAADLKGLKIRTIQTPTYVAALNAMGASATPMAFGEVYTALQTGVLDGFEHSPPVVFTGKYYEVAKYVALTGHLFGPTVTACSMREWQSFTDKERQVLADAAKMAQDVNRNLSAQRDAEAIDLLKSKGMIVTTLDKAPLVTAAAPVQDELAKQIGAEDLLRIIRATK